MSQVPRGNQIMLELKYLLTQRPEPSRPIDVFLLKYKEICELSQMSIDYDL
jgi:hypothetical protein